MFEQLKKAVEKHYNEEAKKQVYFVKNGYCKEWAEEHKQKNDNIIKRYLTPAKWDTYQSGKMTRTEAVEKATKKALADIEKFRQKALAKIDKAENAADVTSVYVSVDWVRNKTWGYNPNASVCVIGCGTYAGRASGCGYDKRTAAISEAFNKSPELLKVLYMAEEKRLKSRPKKNRRDFIGYGSGYSVLPYFEGGVGVSSYYKIFNACGFEFEQTAEGRTFDGYTIRKK